MPLVNMSLYCVLVYLVVNRALGLGLPAKDEYTTYSRFDYEYKVLQKLVQQEEQLAAANERQEELTQTVQALLEQITTLKQTTQVQKEEIAAMKQTTKDDLTAANRRQDELLKTIQMQRENFTEAVEQISALESAIERATQKDTNLEEQLIQHQREILGSTYIRWGRTSCPGNGTELVYPGYAGGSHYTHTGAATSYLCLPQDPLWGKYDDTVADIAMIYGAEYQTSFFPGLDVFDDVPCAVCRSPHPSVLMIPARNECYGNWTLEYHGYLMAGYYGHSAASDYVCVDEQPEALEGGSAANYGKLFYQVEGRCGSLKCPPYVNGREITCVVCSK